MEATHMKGFGVLGTAALLLLFGTTLPAFAQEEHHQSEAKPAQQAEKAEPERQQEQAKPAKQESEAKPASHQAQAKSEKPESQPKPAKQESQAKPAQHEAQAKPAKQEEHAKTEKPEGQTKSVKQESQAKPEHQEQAKPVKQEEHAKTEKQESPAKRSTHEQHANSNGQQHAQRTPAEEERQRAVPALRLSARGSGRIPDDRFRSHFGHEHVFRINQPVIVGGYSRFQYGGYYFGFVQPWPSDWYYTDDVYVDYVDGGYFLYNPYYPGARVSISVVL
jgi:hypothetical protein